MDLKEIKQIAAQEMKNRASHKWKAAGNKYYHGLRTAKIAKELYRRLGFGALPDTLTAAAWLHDIRNGKEEHERLGAEHVWEILQNCCTNEETEKIARLVLIHDSRDMQGLTDEEMVLQDADMLDHFGTFEIWEVFQYSGYHSIPLEETIKWMQDNCFPRYAGQAVALRYLQRNLL